MGGDTKTLRGLNLLPVFFILAGCGGVQFRLAGKDIAPDEPGPPPQSAPSTASAERPIAREKEEEAIQNALKLVETKGSQYQISPGELIEITVFQEAELNKVARVSPEGIISLPLAGPIKVAGLSVAGAEAAIHEKLDRFVINPQVSVFIKEYGRKQVYVLGQVKSPGSYPFPSSNPLTVIEAITLAGGFTEFAAIDRTRVIRKTKSDSRAFMIEVSAIMKGGDKKKDIPLETNDVIFVPETFF